MGHSSPVFRTGARALNYENDQLPSDKDGNSFEELLAGLTPELAGDAAAWQCWLKTGGDPEDSQHSAPAPRRVDCTPVAESEFAQCSPLSASEAETLTLRASTGPLAGMVLEAEWRNRALRLRFSTPPGPRGDRLNRLREQLVGLLEEALGVEVVIEVHDAR